MNDDAKNAPAENPKKERETAEPYLGQPVSGGIGRKINRDSTFRVSSYNQLPRPNDIRRPNREVIQKALEKVLRFARAKVAEAWSPSNPFRSASASPATLVPGRSEESQSFARCETSERIDKPTFIDGMSM